MEHWRVLLEEGYGLYGGAVGVVAGLVVEECSW